MTSDACPISTDLISNIMDNHNILVSEEDHDAD